MRTDTKAKEPEGKTMEKTWQHAANEWADATCNALQWIRNIRDGVSTPDAAIADLEAQIKHCREVQPPTNQTKETELTDQQNRNEAACGRSDLIAVLGGTINGE